MLQILSLVTMSQILVSSPPALKTDEALSLLEEYYGITGSVEMLSSERDQNFRVSAANGRTYLLKISNKLESIDTISFENAIYQHLNTYAPQLPVPRIIKSAQRYNIIEFKSANGELLRLRLMSWLAGLPLSRLPLDNNLRRNQAVLLARLGKSLRGLFHPHACKNLFWDLTKLPGLFEYAGHVDDADLRRLCIEFIQYYSVIVLPDLPLLRAQVIYNDLNSSNVLVDEKNNQDIIGLIDFGDALYAPLVCDVAVAAAYQLDDGADPLAGALEFVAAYHRESRLETEEIDLLFDLIKARLVTTLIITSWRAGIYPENRDYILRNAGVARHRFKTLSAMDNNIAVNRMRRACGLVEKPLPVVVKNHPLETMLERRERLLGSAYRLFYEKPVHIVRGEDVWLFDEQGKVYLDGYNNVPLVGHCHPHVVQALSRQAATLNTHTRYLHDAVLEYAERLLSLFPDQLNQIMFSCTGSEANDLALRIACAYTGNQGVIVSENAYHGNTTAISQLSPSYTSHTDRADWVELIPPPDSYRFSDEDSAGTVGQRFVNGVQNAIERMARRGIKPAALILDCGFTSDGMFFAPDGCLTEAIKRVRQAGGIYIADEVQSGFARFGHYLWGFEFDDIVPEIVTLGKPIGAGHPLAATVIRDVVLDGFSAKSRYFNTFGGNPVSAEVGLAVLDVFQQSGLQDNAFNTGRYFHDQLQYLKHKHKIIGDVRGSGLFAGIDLVYDRQTKNHASDAAKFTVNRMRENGVLISMIGPMANILKIRPPLPFQPCHVDQLISTLDYCLKEAESRFL